MSDDKQIKELIELSMQAYAKISKEGQDKKMAPKASYADIRIAELEKALKELKAQKTDIGSTPPPDDLEKLIEWTQAQKKSPHIQALGKMVMESKAMMTRLDKGAQMIATVISIDDEKVLINLRGAETLVLNPKDPKIPIKIGCQVCVHPETQQIVSLCKVQQPGIEASLVEDLGHEAVIDFSGRRMRLPKNPLMKFEPGSVAIVDRTNSVILDAAPAPKEFVVSSVPNITWDDIGGLEGPKMEMRDAIDTAIVNGDIYTQFGKKPLKGILLFGPAGCGKTLLAKAAANQISTKRADLPAVDGAFMYVKGPELLSMWVGDTENKIRDLFRRACKYKKETGIPGVIFLDEAESLLAGRGNPGTSSMGRTVVPAFLAEWDGLEESGALLILATNRPNDLDDAIMREGRIDRKIGITRPDKMHSAEILAVHLSKTVCLDEIPQMAARTAHTLFIEHPKLVKKVSGALLGNLVDRGITTAIRRAIADKELERGLVMDDLHLAMHTMTAEYQSLH